MNLPRKCLVLLMLILMFSGAGCGGGKNSGEKSQGENKELPKAFMEIENGALSIMQQADLVPIVNELKEQSQEKGEGGAGEQGAKKSGKVSDLTYEDTLLGELLKAEGLDVENQQLPKDTEMIWDNIKGTITELHVKWNELQPQVMKESISQEEIDAFEEELDNLTVFSNEENHFAVMVSANRLSGSLARLMSPFADKKLLPAYEFRYYLRDIVLRAAVGDYARAQESLDYIVRRTPALEQSLDKENIRELESSLEDLQRVLQKQNLELIILNAAVAMKNIAVMR